MLRTNAAAVLAVFVFAAAAVHASDIGCVNPDGNSVDWFFVYKLPKISHSPNPTAAAGLAFAYFDEATPLYVSEKSLRDSDNVIALNLAQLYDNHNNPDTGYLMYNDDTPDGHASSSRGHTKGEMVFNKAGGYWLIHSVPKWPPAAADGYDYPDSEATYGQSFLCITVDLDTVGTISDGYFKFSYPQQYDSALPSTFSPPEAFQQVLAGQHYVSDPYSNVFEFKSRGGMSFTGLAKNKKWDKDIFEDLIAPHFDSNMKARTWQNGRGKMGSYCKPEKQYDVENVIHVSLPDTVMDFDSTKCHSKLGVTSSEGKTIACVGGINRQTSQATRPGGYVCMEHVPFWQTLSNIFSMIESCEIVDNHALRSNQPDIVEADVVDP